MVFQKLSINKDNTLAFNKGNIETTSNTFIQA